MHKTQKIGWAFLIGVLLAFPLGAYAGSAHQPVSTEPAQPIVLFKASGVEWVRKCVDQYPEILWLADAKVRKTDS